MTFNFTNPVAKFSVTLATSAMLLLSTTTASYAGKEKEMVFDDIRGNFTSCLLDGGTGSETSSTFSCTTPGGQITTCDKGGKGNPVDLCGTEVDVESGRVTGGKQKLMIDRFMAPLTTGKSQPTGSTPRPGKYIMQYSVQN